MQGVSWGTGLSDSAIRRLLEKVTVEKEIGRFKDYVFHHAASKNKHYAVAVLDGKIVGAVGVGAFVWIDAAHRREGLALELYIARRQHRGARVFMLNGKPAVRGPLEDDPDVHLKVTPAAMQFMWKVYEVMVERGLIEETDG